MIKSILAIAAIATAVSAAAPSAASPAPVNHIMFTQPVGNGIIYPAGTNQTFSWTMSCTPPSTLVSATPSATEVDFMDSNNMDNAFYIKKVGTIDCTKGVGNLVWTVPADTKPGIYALQFLLTPNNAYSGRFNVTAPGSASSPGPSTGGSNGGATGGAQEPPSATPKSAAAPALSAGLSVAVAAAVAGAAAMLL
ncbi:unnamed protein product [Mortierella alpina]